MTQPGKSIDPIRILILTTLIWLALFAMRLAGPSDLRDNDQERPAAYVLDAVRNGNWICQSDFRQDISSKPPLYTWLAALATFPVGRISRLTLYLPGALAVLATAWLILAFGSRYFGRLAGWLGATAFLLSMTTWKQICLARTDPLFAVLVFATALSAFSAWNRGKGWTVFWLLCAATTLTKGPLGILLAAGGLFAVPWEKRSGHPIPLKGSQLTGIFLFLFLTLGWFLAAYLVYGRALIDKMILNELVGHAVTSGKGRLPGSGFYKPTLYFISRFAPWSLFTLAGLWRAWKSPNERHIVRRVERFLSCYFIFGLVIFSLSPHQRADHLLPLIPAATLLAGREIERWVAGLPIERLTRIIYTAAGIWLGLIAIYSGLFLMNSSAVKKTRSLENLAKQVRQQVGSEFPLTHLDDHYTLQFYLNTMRPQVSLDQAAKLLSDPDHAAFVATRKGDKLRAKLSANEHPLYTVAQWPPAGTPEVQILSNHPRLEYTQQMGLAFGPYQLKLDGVHLQKTRRNHFYFWAKQPYGSITITNHSQTEQFVHLHLINTAADEMISRGTLKAGQSWTIPFGQKKSPEQSLTVGQIADCRQAYAHRRWLARNQAFTQLDYLFVNGDFVFESDWRYDLFLKQSREWSVPIFPVLGNHDIVKRSPYPRESFQNRFGYLTTWFDDGPARFVLLETSYKRLGKYQLEQLPKILSKQPVPPVKCIFQHVPPRVLQHEGPTSRADAEILLNLSSEEGVDRIYCGHLNGFKYQEHHTEKGEITVLVSSGGGEKQYEKDYPLHWLKIAVTPQGVQDTEVKFPEPSRAASIGALFSIKGLFLLQRFGSLILLILGITALFYFGAKWTLEGMGKSVTPEA